MVPLAWGCWRLLRRSRGCVLVAAPDAAVVLPRPVTAWLV